MTWESKIEGLNIDQLKDFREAISKAITQKEHEKMRLIWRVRNRWQTFGDFREDDYLGAVNRLVETANKLNADGDTYSMPLSIEQWRIPESEYEDWFK
ncbi:hypothetical protein [Proteus penneri]|uniref:hypothetical protein n=1 Tax=Proteus penneri TaxID=102862 RepID=UPI000DFA0DE6|nr:hypothetical protein [Proteus penneri]SUB99942.1 Uncharacterised protein [Proteus penneri]